MPGAGSFKRPLHEERFGHVGGRRHGGGLPAGQRPPISGSTSGPLQHAGGKLTAPEPEIFPAFPGRAQPERPNNNNRRQNPAGGFPTSGKSGVVRPDLVLRDLRDDLSRATASRTCYYKTPSNKMKKCRHFSTFRPSAFQPAAQAQGVRQRGFPPLTPTDGPDVRRAISRYGFAGRPFTKNLAQISSTAKMDRTQKPRFLFHGARAAHRSAFSSPDLAVGSVRRAVGAMSGRRSQAASCDPATSDIILKIRLLKSRHGPCFAGAAPRCRRTRKCKTLFSANPAGPVPTCWGVSSGAGLGVRAVSCWARPPAGASRGPLVSSGPLGVGRGCVGSARRSCWPS